MNMRATTNTTGESVAATMAKEWTDEEVETILRDSARILHEDGEKASYARLHEKYGEKTDPPKGDGKTDPPPKKEKEEPKAKKPLWGSYADEE